MIAQQKDDLLELFCQYSFAEIIANKGDIILNIMKVQDPDDLNKDADYGKFYKLLKDAIERIEKRILSEAASEVQVKESLKYMKEKLKEGHAEAIKCAGKMISRKPFIKWDADNQNRYRTGLAMLTEWVHFFISYTNKNTPSVNNTFKTMLEHDFSDDVIVKAKDTVNMVARLLHNYFKMQRVYTFYDKEKIEWSDDFREQIFDYTSKSFAFVQFVETKMFEDAPDKNYCYQEFASYKEAVSKFAETYKIKEFQPSCFFLISNPENIKDYKFIPAGEMEPELEEWAEYIKSKQFVTLHLTMTNEELRQKVQNAAEQIVELRKKTFDGYIASF